jgi:hypothetical protein
VQCLDSLIGRLRQCFETFPDKRRGMNITYSIADIAMAAFSVFFMQSPSFLAHQRHLQEGHGRSNCEGLFGINKIPSDNHIRDMLDPAAPALLYPMFPAVLEELEQSGGLSAFRRLGDHVLIALDGSEYFCSKSISCPHCSTRLRGKSKGKGKGKGKDKDTGTTEYFHAMLGATLVAPGHNQVVPLEPEFISPQDGAEKQDCEARAVQRWLAKHGAQYARRNPIYLGDDLHSRQPTCEAVIATGGNFLFVCKPASHPLIQEHITGIELPSLAVPVKRGRKRFTYRYRWLSGVPLRDGDDALKVNWLEIEIHDADGNVTYRNSFITDLPISRDNVAELAACGRARWKIENETFNTLKTGGYHLEHSYGHGKQNLAALLVTLNLLAFAFHTVCDHAEELWQRARSKASSRAQFFSRLVAITSFLIFPSWDDLVRTLAFLQPPPQPP